MSVGRVSVGDMDRVDSVDAATGDAWAGFRAMLADHLDAMPADRSLIVSCPTTAAEPVSPCIQFYGWDDDTLRCEVLSDEFLAPRRAWTEAGRDLLIDAGFVEPARAGTDSPDAVDEDVPVNWFLDRSRRYADLFADVAVRILHEVWDVPHPAFVHIGGDSAGPLLALPEVPAPARPFDTFRAVRTADASERRVLVEQTLRHLLGFVPEPDEDGDYPFRLGPAWLYLCLSPGAPFVQILAPLAAGVTDAARAHVVVNDANRRWPHVKVLLDEDRVLATIDVSVVPFVPQQVVDMLAVMEKFMVDAAGDLVAGLGARPYLDAFGEPTERDTAVVPEGLRAIVESVWESGPDLSCEAVLEMCGHDRAIVVQYLDIARGRESAALERTLDDEDPRTAASAGLDARVWRTASALLTAAHRRLAADLHDPSRSTGSQLDLFGTDMAGGTGDSLFD